MKKENEEAYSANQVAKMVGRSVNTICFHCKRLGIAKTKVGGLSTYLITEEDLEEIKKHLRR